MMNARLFVALALPLLFVAPTWSPDGRMIVCHRVPSNQLWIMPADGSALPVQLTAAFSSGFNLLATSWSVIGVGKRGR